MTDTGEMGKQEKGAHDAEKGEKAAPDDGTSPPRNGAATGYEAELRATAAALRCLMEAAEYKHVVLGRCLPEVHL